jgi:hypothetical protein
MEHIGIETSAMLIELNISTWTARKLDKKVSQEVDQQNETKINAGNYHKNLLAGQNALDAWNKYSARIRLWYNQQTLPWADKGPRLLTSQVFMDGFKVRLDEHHQNWLRLRDNFEVSYEDMVSAAAFSLGKLFNREDYPPLEDVMQKFSFRYAFSPVPTSGDFRIDIGHQARKELEEMYAQTTTNRVNTAMREVWDRLHECLTHMSERLADDEDGNRKGFHSTLITNAVELVDMLDKLNVTQDPQLTHARKELERSLYNINADTVKESDQVREGLKKKVDDILSRFDW